MAQVLLFEESFDFYLDQSFAGVVSPYMGTWSGNTGFGTDDCQITDLESFSAPNSIAIYGPNAGGQIDAMINFPSDYTSGRFEYTMRFKVAAAKGGYFNFQPSSANVGNAWMVQVFFAADSTGKLYGGGQNMPFNYPNGNWFEFKLECDLDLDTAFVWIDNNLVGTGFKWSVESNGFGNGSNNALGGINLFSTSGDPVADCEYYVDDLLLVETTGLGIQNLSNDVAFTVFPNPSDGNFEIVYLGYEMGVKKIDIHDIKGNLVESQATFFSDHSNIPLAFNLIKGAYYISISTTGSTSRQKLIIR